MKVYTSYVMTNDGFKLIVNGNMCFISNTSFAEFLARDKFGLVFGESLIDGKRFDWISIIGKHKVEFGISELTGDGIQRMKKCKVIDTDKISEDDIKRFFRSKGFVSKDEMKFIDSVRENSLSDKWKQFRKKY